LCTVHL